MSVHYGIIKNKASGEVYQLLNEPLFMIVDTLTGESIRFGDRYKAIGTYSEACKHLKTKVISRYVIVELNCFVPHEIEP